MNLVAPCRRRNQSDAMPDRTTQRPAQRTRGSTTIATGQQEREIKCPKRSASARRRRETDPDYGKRCRGLVGTEVAWAFPIVRTSPEKHALKNRVFASEAFRRLSPQLQVTLRELLHIGGAPTTGKVGMVNGFTLVKDLAGRLRRGDRSLSPRQTSRLLGELERRGWIATAPILPRRSNRGIAFTVFDSPSAGPVTLTGDQLHAKTWPRRTGRKGPDQSPMTGPDQSRMTGPDQSEMSGPGRGLHHEPTPPTTAGPRKASVGGAEVRLGGGGGALHAPEPRTSEPPVRVTVTADPPVRLHAVEVEDPNGTLAWLRSKTNVVLDRHPEILDFLAGQSIATVSRTWKECGKTAKNPAGVFVTRARSRNMEIATGGSEGRMPPLARIDPEGALVAGEDRKRIFASIRETIRPGGRVAANP